MSNQASVVISIQNHLGKPCMKNCFNETITLGPKLLKVGRKHLRALLGAPATL